MVAFKEFRFRRYKGYKWSKLNINFKMQTFLACICCCCDCNEQTPVIQQKPQGQKKKKKVVAAKPTRLRTKYARGDFQEVKQQDRRQKGIKAYCCPICTLYFTRILACSECVNFICFGCFQGYDTKNTVNKQKLKCPFCSSLTSYFGDYQLDPHSYFDTTNKGFLSKQQRLKVDSQGILPIVQSDLAKHPQQIQQVQQNQRQQ